MQNIRPMSSGPSESQMCCSFSGSAQQRNPLSRLRSDLPFLQLPFGPFMPVQAQFHAPRRIAANFDEEGSEVGIVNVEIVVVDVDGLVPVELKLSVYLLPVECLRLLLGHSDEYDAVADLPLAAELIGYVVLPFLVIELIKRYAIRAPPRTLLSRGISHPIDTMQASAKYRRAHYWIQAAHI